MDKIIPLSYGVSKKDHQLYLEIWRIRRNRKVTFGFFMKSILQEFENLVWNLRKNGVFVNGWLKWKYFFPSRFFVPFLQFFSALYNDLTPQLDVKRQQVMIDKIHGKGIYKVLENGELLKI